MQNSKFVTPLGDDGMYILDTAAWRTERPVIDKQLCINCGLCMVYCPVNSIYCEGCGICSVECPKKAVSMVPEGGK